MMAKYRPTHIRNWKQEYLNDKLKQFNKHSRNKKIRDLYTSTSSFNKGYQPRMNLVKDGNVDNWHRPTEFWVGDSITCVSSWISMGINDLRQTLRAELLISKPSVSEVAIYIEKFLRDKSQVESLVVVVQIGGTRVMSWDPQTIWNKVEVSQQKKGSSIVCI